jgi:hypothetical protein
VPAELGVKVMVFEASGLVVAPRPVPSGESMLSAVSVSPEPAANVARMLVDCPMYMELLLAAMVVVGAGGGVTLSVPAGVPELSTQVAVPPEPIAVPV